MAADVNTPAPVLWKTSAILQMPCIETATNAIAKTLPARLEDASKNINI